MYPGIQWTQVNITNMRNINSKAEMLHVNLMPDCVSRMIVIYLYKIDSLPQQKRILCIWIVKAKIGQRL